MQIDCHTHFVPMEYLTRLDEHGAAWQTRVTFSGEARTQIEFLNPAAYFRREPLVVTERHHSTTRRRQDLKRLSLDVQVLSTPTYLFRYDLASGAAAEHARAYNDALIHVVRSDADHFWGLGILPLQDPQGAVAEFQRLMNEPGIIGVEIGTRVGTLELDASELMPVYEFASASKALVLIHPSSLSSPERLQDHYLTHLVGLPAETTLAAARLMLGGVLDRFPQLVICFAHAGGYLLFGLGRLEHSASSLAKSAAARPLRDYMNQLYFDSVAHGPGVLEFVVSQTGSQRVLMGSDYPAGTGLPDPVETVQGIQGLRTEDKRRIMGDNLMEIVSRQENNQALMRRV